MADCFGVGVNVRIGVKNRLHRNDRFWRKPEVH
jgi:hypothetical protein